MARRSAALGWSAALRWSAALCVAGAWLASGDLATPAWADAAAYDWIAEAHEAARRDAHPDAIAAYLAALETDPALRDSVSSGLASQLTWAGRYDEAIAEFRWHLSRHPNRIDNWLTLALAQAWSDQPVDALTSYQRALALEPGNTRARLGEARMLSWSHRPAEAEARYAAILLEHPDLVEARLGLAQVRNWRGDHRAAWRVYEGVLAQPGAPAEAWEGLAQAQAWAGRPDLALATLRDQERAGLATASSRELERGLRRGSGWSVLSAVDVATDSDDFHANSARIEVEVPAFQRGHLRFGLRRNRYDRPDRMPLTDSWVLASGGYRLATPWIVTGAVRVAFDSPSGAEETPFEVDFGAAWLPDDRWRIDLSASRFSLFTFEASPDRITGSLLGAGVTWRAREALWLVASGDRASYSDDNSRANLRTRARWRVPGGATPRFWLEGGGQYLDFDRWLPNGIWTPDRYRAVYVRGDTEVDLRRNLIMFGGLDGGWASEAPGPFVPYLAWNAGAAWTWDRLRLEARAGHSEGNLETGRGYRRTSGSVSASVGF